MTRFFLIIATLLLLAYSQAVRAQDCPSGKVCLDQATANRLYDVAEQLIQAKDVINKMLSERNASDATIAAANKVIEAMNDREAINGQIIVKLKDLNALYEKVIALQQTIIEKLTAQINKPKSAWQKFVQTLREVAYLAGGILLGRAIP